MIKKIEKLMSEKVTHFDKNKLGIVIMTTPIRPVPTEYPPIGSLSVVKALKDCGYSNTTFIDIDGLSAVV